MDLNFRSLAVCAVSAMGLLTLCPSPVLASDFGPLVTEFLVTAAIGAGIALTLGAVTSALFVWIHRRKWIWLLTPVFGAFWFAVLFGLHQLWINRDADQYKNWKPPKERVPTQIPIPAPEGVPPRNE